MPSPSTDPKTILFLAANPKDTGRLRLDQELRYIAEGLQRSQHRDHFKLAQRWAVRLHDIQRAMLDTGPQIIHFSGHGEGEAGLVFEDEVGNAKLVDGAALAGLFALFADQITCVVLNGCYSELQAKAIAKHIPYVIGMNRAIGDRAAIAFAVGFYDALGAGRSIEFAYRLGCSSIQMEQITEHLMPVLHHQANVTVRSISAVSTPNEKPDICYSNNFDTLIDQAQERYDNFIVELREECRRKIIEKPNNMRLVSGDQIQLSQLYVDVHLLDKLPKNCFITQSQLRENLDLLNDRLGLGDRLSRKPGISMAQENSRLLVLGKPGSGKTTFLKNLLADWGKKRFQPDLITVFIEFRGMQECQLDILDLISEKLGFKDDDTVKKIKNILKQLKPLKEEIGQKIEKEEERITPERNALLRNREEEQRKIILLSEELNGIQARIEKTTERSNLESRARELNQKITKLESQVKKINQQITKLETLVRELQRQAQSLEDQIKALKRPVKTLLKKGKLLLLMDGLDELPKSEFRQYIQDEVQRIGDKYFKSRIILTCRTLAIGKIPDGFVSVEMAEFDSDQVKNFVRNWFVSNNKSAQDSERQWNIFDREIRKDLSLKELASTPVLLDLMCWVFHSEGRVPSSKAFLYQKGVELLLKKINNNKGISEWEIGFDYKNYENFTIEQKEKLLINLAFHKFEDKTNFILFTQEEAAAQIANFLRLSSLDEGEKFLRAIEASHGLLVERADGLWSFSHLTFQEYFTAKWLNQIEKDQDLANKIVERHWQEVFRLAVQMKQPANYLLKLTKQAIDRSISNEPEIQKFLNWVLSKSKPNQEPFYISSALRAFYFTLTFFNFGNDFSFDSSHRLAQTLGFDINRSLYFDQAFDSALVSSLAHALRVRTAINCFSHLDPARELHPDLDYRKGHDPQLALAYEHQFNEASTDLSQLVTTQFLDSSTNFARKLDPELASFLETLQERLKDFTPEALLSNTLTETDWDEWIKQFKETIIEPRKVGCDWSFTDKQEQRLSQYYEANLFLLELIEIDGAVDSAFRAEIEETLLLPWSELEANIQPKLDSMVSSASPVQEPQPSNGPIEVFISYSHSDEVLLNELLKSLALLKRQGKIVAWHDRAIEAGEEWEPQLKGKLESARIILLLISPDFMHSDYCYDIEMQRAIERHDAGSARVIPIILRPSDWQGSPFSKLQALPKDIKPITQWGDRDSAFLDVAKGIRRAVELLAKK